MSILTQLKRIAISEKNYRRIKGLGTAGDTLDDVISQLLELWDREEAKKK